MRVSRSVVIGAVIGLLTTPAFAIRAAESPACNGPKTERVVNAFASAYSRGRQTGLDRTIARNGFRSYADPRAFAGAIPFATRDREMLFDYFQIRHRLHDKLHVQDVRAALNPRDHSWQFQFEIHRVADDILLPGGIVQHGKGVMSTSCRIAIWEMGS